MSEDPRAGAMVHEALFPTAEQQKSTANQSGTVLKLKK